MSNYYKESLCRKYFIYVFVSQTIKQFRYKSKLDVDGNLNSKIKIL